MFERAFELHFQNIVNKGARHHTPNVSLVLQRRMKKSLPSSCGSDIGRTQILCDCLVKVILVASAETEIHVLSLMTRTLGTPRDAATILECIMFRREHRVHSEACGLRRQLD